MKNLKNMEKFSKKVLDHGAGKWYDKNYDFVDKL
jgi:hypothetical protein